MHVLQRFNAGWAVVLLVAAAGGCINADLGRYGLADAGFPPDAAPATDGGSPPGDVSPPTDAPPGTDVPLGTDGGVIVDGGTADVSPATDTGTDTGSALDVGMSTDIGTDTGIDTGIDTGTGADAGFDTGTDVGVAPDTGTDTGTWMDTGTDTGASDTGVGGCITSASCPLTDYCAGSGCSTPGTCVLKPLLCPLIVFPVCGCNGATYSNGCFAERAGVRVAHTGTCTAPADAGTDAAVTCTTTGCPTGELCCPSSGRCYSSRCLSCCLLRL